MSAMTSSARLCRVSGAGSWRLSRTTSAACRLYPAPARSMAILGRSSEFHTSYPRNSSTKPSAAFSPSWSSQPCTTSSIDSSSVLFWMVCARRGSASSTSPKRNNTCASAALAQSLVQARPATAALTRGAADGPSSSNQNWPALFRVPPFSSLPARTEHANSANPSVRPSAASSSAAVRRLHEEAVGAASTSDRSHARKSVSAGASAASSRQHSRAPSTGSRRPKSWSRATPSEREATSA